MKKSKEPSLGDFMKDISKMVEHLNTLNGPQAKEHLSAPLDYQFYIDRQLEAVADGILPFVGSSFSQVMDKQMGLF